MHDNGAFGRKYLPETMGSGGAFLDADGDGWQDILLVNGTNWPGRPASRAVMALYRNNRNGTFTDVAAAAGLAVPLYGMGVAAADYDNDGRTDIYITAVGRNRLFRNLGGLKFADVTDSARVGDGGFSASAAWLDYDRDGLLDLFVTNYVDWSIETDRFCALDGKNKSYCTPEAYQGQRSTLYRNQGKGVFADVTKAAGLADPQSKALGVALIDYNDDGWLDLFVANDTRPNRLYENKRNGTFADVAVAAGVAFNDAGVARAGMGVDAADYNGSGRQSLVVGNFSNEMIALYANGGQGLFVDEAPTSVIGRASMLTLTFATLFFDYDLDGRADIFAANGHVADDISRVQPRISHAQPPHLFRNAGGGRFEVATPSAGKDLQAADGRARRRLRRLRRRRRSRPPDHRQQRRRTAAAQRRRRTQPPPAPAARGHPRQPRRDWRVRPRHPRRRPVAVADGQDRLFLLLPERAAADVRPRGRGLGLED